MNDNVKSYLAFCQQVSEATEQSLESYFAKSEENLQFPNLVAMVSNLINHDPKVVADVDQHVRQYVRRHGDYHVSRGAKGGIMKMAVYQKRQAGKAAQEAAKQQIAAQVEAKVAAKTATVVQPTVVADSVVDVSVDASVVDTNDVGSDLSI